MERVNLYETLGVTREDSAALVRRAYRDLARLSHATTDAVPQFVREMEVAVDVLSDAARRTHYDDVVRAESGSAAGPGDVGAEPRATHLDLLRDFEGGRPSREEVWTLFRCNFAPGAEPKSGHLQVLDLHLRIDGPSQAIAQLLCLRVPLFHACAVCHGTGSIDWVVACRACDGSGVAEERSQVRVTVSPRECTIPLDELGVRTPILRLHVALA